MQPSCRADGACCGSQGEWMLGIPKRNGENGFLWHTCPSCWTNLLSAVRHILRTWAAERLAATLPTHDLLKSQSRQFFITSWPLLHRLLQDAATNGLGDHKPKNRIETSLWQAFSMSSLDRARTANFGVHKTYGEKSFNLTMFELDGDSGLNNSPLLTTLISSWGECFCNSIAEQTLPGRFVRPIFHGHSHFAHAFVSFVWCSTWSSDTINSGLLTEWKQISFTLCPVDCNATAWEYCFAMCRNDNKSIYQRGWYIKLWKLPGFVNRKYIVNVQIIFHTQPPPYKLDTSIICCSVIVSTWDASKQQIGDMANLPARRHGRWDGTSELWKDHSSDW